eukprot:IDg18462t1
MIIADGLRWTKTDIQSVEDAQSGAAYGLSQGRSLSSCRADPVCHLSFFNYRLEAQVGSTKETQQNLLTVLDTGDGHNLIRAALLPDDF